ncbi:type I secretion system permease/ATPase [Pseudogemmobacter hezensis]|uniref:type I secretion system permease/ATPase n=1 Tax=Pseudogemmobacter hezensis TaxID=2737662 RepID=UPI001C1308B9
MTRIARHYRIALSPEQLRVESTWASAADMPERLARLAGLSCHEAGLRDITPLRLPLAVSFADGQTGVIETLQKDGYGIALAGDGGAVTPVSHQDFAALSPKIHALRPAFDAPDARVDHHAGPARRDWLREILMADLRPYRAIMLASLVTNILSLGGILFSMQVYDRVVPSQSLNTLYVLFGGVVLALIFGHLMRIARARITDANAKAADLVISDRVFSHAIRVRNSARPRSTGTFISQLRELEQVREMMTSTTVAAVADAPFFLLFCLLFFYIAGPLVWIPLTAAALLVLPGFLAQRRLRALAEENSRESALRSGMLVEAVQGLDDLKSLQAEARFTHQWTHFNTVTAESGKRLRDLTNRLGTWSQTVQTGVFAVVIFFGAPQVMAGEMSTGVLVAASMLSSRMIAPLASVTQILSRWQQAKVARESLDGLMELPLDAPPQARRIHKPLIRGAFRLKDAVFGHDGETPVLRVAQLSIAPGERIGILGPNGSGKSTLLAALSGLLEPISGEVRLDDVTLSLLDPADVRRDIGFMGQNARLFHGTLRENLTLGAPMASDEALLKVADQLGLLAFIRQRKDGLESMVQEGGLGLSGGQRQGLLLARLLLRRPQLLLLDEPTAALDEMAENAVINTLAARDPGQGVIIATHRPAALRMVDRLIVVSGGAIALDGPKDEVLDRLRRGKGAA